MLRFVSWLVQDAAKPQFPPYMAGVGSAQLGRCPAGFTGGSGGPGVQVRRPSAVHTRLTSPSPGPPLGYLSVLFGLTTNLWSLTVLARPPVGPA